MQEFTLFSATRYTYVTHDKYTDDDTKSNKVEVHMYDACVVFIPDPFTGTNFKSLGIDNVASSAEYAEFENDDSEAELIAKFNHSDPTGIFSILTILCSLRTMLFRFLDNTAQLCSTYQLKVWTRHLGTLNPWA